MRWQKEQENTISQVQSLALPGIFKVEMVTTTSFLGVPSPPKWRGLLDVGVGCPRPGCSLQMEFSDEKERRMNKRPCVCRATAPRVQKLVHVEHPPGALLIHVFIFRIKFYLHTHAHHCGWILLSSFTDAGTEVCGAKYLAESYSS